MKAKIQTPRAKSTNISAISGSSFKLPHPVHAVHPCPTHRSETCQLTITSCFLSYRQRRTRRRPFKKPRVISSRSLRGCPCASRSGILLKTSKFVSIIKGIPLPKKSDLLASKLKNLVYRRRLFWETRKEWKSNFVFQSTCLPTKPAYLWIDIPFFKYPNVSRVCFGNWSKSEQKTNFEFVFCTQKKEAFLVLFTF